MMTYKICHVYRSVERDVLERYLYSVAGIVIEWISHGMKDSPESSILRLGELLNGNIRYTFMKPKEE